MVAKRDAKWECKGKTYELVKGQDISINKAHEAHAIASKLFYTEDEPKETTPRGSLLNRTMDKLSN